MILRSHIKNTIVEIICLSYILLFVYAAVSKLMDFENFRIQLGQSPVLGPFAEIMAILVPFLELAIAVSLAIPRFRFWAIISSFLLMFLFTIYIYIILKYSSFIPCSCGGILENMTWKQHLVFNIIITVGAGICMFLLPVELSKKNCGPRLINFKIFLLTTCIFAGITLMTILFRFSEKTIHYKNKFVRRFPQHTAQEIYKIDLKYNSYYFAGTDKGTLYLGNITTPLKIYALDTSKRVLKKFQINLKEKNLSFKAPKIKVLNDNFYVFEGEIPYVFQGKTSNWSVNLKIRNATKFLNAEIIDSANFVMRYPGKKNGQIGLAVINTKDSLEGIFNNALLEKQFDGIIDTDGSLLYNEQLKKIIYVYYYRNQYLLINPKLQFLSYGNTIDTVTKAQVKLVKNKNTGMITLAKPPLMVNRISASYGNLLFINSTLPGQYESDKLWRISSIIDVYDVTDISYRSSFPVYNVDGKKIRSMIVNGQFLYVLVDENLICYKLRSHLTQNRTVKKSKK